MLVSNIVYNVLLIDILFGEIKKNGITHTNHFALLRQILTLTHVIFVFALILIGIISNKCCDRKSSNQFLIQI